jgi:hypothetical protein
MAGTWMHGKDIGIIKVQVPTIVLYPGAASEVA